MPVMPSDRVSAFSKMVDELIYVDAPRDFHAVGQFYQRFDQTEDEEVLDLMRRNLEECSRWAAEDKQEPKGRDQPRRTYSEAASH